MWGHSICCVLYVSYLLLFRDNIIPMSSPGLILLVMALAAVVQSRICALPIGFLLNLKSLFPKDN